MCIARVSTILDTNSHVIKKAPTDHCHDPLSYSESVYEANVYVKEKATTTYAPPSKIVAWSEAACSQNKRVYLPSLSAQKKKIRRNRKKYVQGEPKTLDELEIPNDLKFVDGEVFVLAEKTFDSDKIIILGTLVNIRQLVSCVLWLMDGTFDVVPSISRQLFSIHGKVDGEIVPLLYCLMSSKSLKCYSEFFSEIKTLAAKNDIVLSPKYIFSDFEKESVKAAITAFSAAESRGCLFHFGQIIWRKIQSSGHQREYGNNEDFSLQMRMLKSLAFVPAEEVADYFDVLKRNCSEIAAPIVKWRKLCEW